MGASVLLTSLGLVAETRQIITWDTTEVSQLLSPDKDFAKAIFDEIANGKCWDKMRLNVLGFQVCR